MQRMFASKIHIKCCIFHSLGIIVSYLKKSRLKCHATGCSSLLLLTPYLRLPLPLPCRPSLFLHRLPLSPPLRSLHALQLLAQHGFEGVVAAGQQHDVVGVDGFAAGVFGEDFEVAGGVCDLRVDQLGQCADKLGRGVEVGCQAFFVDVLADGVPEGGFEALFSQLVGTKRQCSGKM
jgi:hypothetical protein